MSTFEDEMAGYQEEWQEAQDNARADGMLADGDYQAKIVESRVEKSDWDEWQLYLKYEDMNGAGSIRSWDSLDHEVGRSIAAERTKRLGYVGPITGLRQACEAEQFLDLVCDIRVKTKQGETRDFKQVYVNRVYGRATEEGVPVATTAAPTTDDDDDIPF